MDYSKQFEVEAYSRTARICETELAEWQTFHHILSEAFQHIGILAAPVPVRFFVDKLHTTNRYGEFCQGVINLSMYIHVYLGNIGTLPIAPFVLAHELGHLHHAWFVPGSMQSWDDIRRENYATRFAHTVLQTIANRKLPMPKTPTHSVEVVRVDPMDAVVNILNHAYPGLSLAALRYPSQVFTSAKGHKRRKYAVPCPECGQSRWVAKSDIDPTQRCFNCAQSIKAAKSWQVCADKYGRSFAIKRLQKARLARPSALELAVALLLSDHKIDFEREALIKNPASEREYLVDFLAMRNGYRFAVEVQGTYFHSLPGRADRDAHKADTLAALGIPLLTIGEADIRAGRAEQMIVSFTEVKV